MIVGKKIAYAVAKNNCKQNPFILQLQNNLFPVRYGSNQAKFGGKSVLDNKNPNPPFRRFPGASIPGGFYQNRAFYDNTNNDRPINKTKWGFRSITIFQELEKFSTLVFILTLVNICLFCYSIWRKHCWKMDELEEKYNWKMDELEEMISILKKKISELKKELSKLKNLTSELEKLISELEKQKVMSQ